MANIKISELDELQKATDQDLLVIVDIDNNKTKKIQAGNLGILVPKTTKTTSDTETYSCNYVNTQVDDLNTTIAGVDNIASNKPDAIGTYAENPMDTYNCVYINDAINSIIESGSNDKGNWIKYNDGTMICTRTIPMTISCNKQWGSLYYGTNTDPWDFSQTFIAPPIMSIKCIKTGNGSFFVGEYTGLEIGNSYFKNIDIIRPNSYNNIKVSVHCIAIGRWK